MPLLAPVALVPAAARALGAVVRRSEGPIAIRRIGYGELGHTVLFAVLAVVVFRMTE